MPWGMKCDLSTYDWFGAWVLLKKASGLPSMKNDKKRKEKKSAIGNSFLVCYFQNVAYK